MELGGCVQFWKNKPLLRVSPPHPTPATHTNTHTGLMIGNKQEDENPQGLVWNADCKMPSLLSKEIAWEALRIY